MSLPSFEDAASRKPEFIILADKLLEAGKPECANCIMAMDKACRVATEVMRHASLRAEDGLIVNVVEVVGEAALALGQQEFDDWQASCTGEPAPNRCANSNL